MIEEENEYRRDLHIDKYSLEDALLEQAELYAKWNARWAEAVRQKSEAKEELEIVRSALDRKARKSWEILGFPKAPTDQMVNNWIPAQDEYKEKMILFIEATYRANVLDGAKWGFDNRSRALTDLVKLYLSGYYADEKMVGKDARDLLDEIRKEKHLDTLNKDNQKALLKRRKK